MKIKNIQPIDKLMLVILIIWIALAILFGTYDLDISKAIVDTGSFWGALVYDFGEGPGYGLIAVCLVIMAGSSSELDKQKQWGILGLASGLITLVLGLISGIEYMAMIGGSVSVSISLFLFLARHRDWNQYRKVALFVLLVALIVPLISVQGLKILSARVRFYDLLPDFSDYTQWYIFQGPALGNSSFPSGHTAMAWMLLPLLIPILSGSLSQFKKSLISGLILGWGLFVGFCRFLVGEHYASDVLFSTGIAFLTCYFLYKKWYWPDKHVQTQLNPSTI